VSLSSDGATVAIGSLFNDQNAGHVRVHSTSELWWAGAGAARK
jgi:hypothetical protein